MNIIKKIAIWSTIVIAVVGIFVVIGKGSSSDGAMSSTSAVKKGDTAPDFSLRSSDGTIVTLSSFRDKQRVLIYFHEGLTCDPCMQQMPEVDKYASEFEKMNVKVLHIALDSPEDMNKAVVRYKLKSPVLSYNNATTEMDYNLLEKSMGMGRRAGHTFVLVGTDGKIVWREDYWKSKGHMAEGTMFVDGSEILSEVQNALGEQL